MALPPERLTIKRRRDDDPVDCLYLQQKRIRSDYVWNRIIDDRAVKPHVTDSRSAKLGNGSDLARDDSLQNRAPVVRATLPGEEGLTRNGARTKSFHDIRTSKTAQAKCDKPLQRPQRLTTTRTREFHLTKNSFLFPSHVQAGQGIHKYNKKAPSRLAVFVEKGVREDPLRAASKPVHQHTKREIFGSSKMPLEQARRNFDGLPKRPRATEAELAWRMKTWKNVDGPYKSNSPANHAIADESERSGTSKANQPVVTEEMLAILQEMSREAEESSAIPAAVSTGKLNTVSQAAHSDEVGEEIESMDMEAAAGKDDGYVFDTYVRARGPEQQTTPDLVESVTGVLPAIQAETVGVLVICEEDEREWQEFLQEESESDKEWDTDEEDENAEDYYGNDYPEDEVDSDDEFDRDAYRYRIDESEDEEFGSGQDDF